MEDCTRIAGDMLRYFPEDAAKVEGHSHGATRWRTGRRDPGRQSHGHHELDVTSAEQAYRVIQRTAGGDLSIEIILDQ